MTSKHPYPKWLRWLLPYENPSHPLHYSPDDQSEDEVLDQLAEVMGEDFVDRIRKF